MVAGPGICATCGRFHSRRVGSETAQSTPLDPTPKHPITHLGCTGQVRVQVRVGPRDAMMLSVPDEAAQLSGIRS
jgi:hypothetical protein